MQTDGGRQMWKQGIQYFNPSYYFSEAETISRS